MQPEARPFGPFRVAFRTSDEFRCPRVDPSSMGRSRPLIVNNYAQGRSAVSDIHVEKRQDSGERGDSADGAVRGALGATGRLKHDIKQALKSKKDTAPVTRTGMDTRLGVGIYTDPPPTMD